MPSGGVPTDVFTVTEEVLDFARVAVLFVLQEGDLSKASAAQVALQRFFDSTDRAVDEARNVSLGNGNSVDLINFTVDTGDA